jgi:hypothetical protein
MADGATGADKIKELEQQRGLLQWMIDNQKRVNNGVKEHLKSRQQLLAVEETIAYTEGMVLESKKEIAKLEKEAAKAGEDRKRVIQEEIRWLKTYNADSERLLDIQKKERDGLKKTLSLKKALGNEIQKQIVQLNKELFSVKKLKSYYLEIDKGIRMTTQSMGLSAGNAEILRSNMLDAAEHGARFGVTVSEMAKVQKDISRSTGRNLIASADNLKNIANIVKLVPDVGNTIGLLDKFGYGMGKTMDIVEEVYNYAGKVGLDAQEMSKNFAANIGIASRFRFKGGIDDLKKLTAEAQRFKVNMESIAGFAEKVFRPEGAIEAAAQLQVLGGSFGMLGDPFKLMHMARNDMEGFTKAIIDATSTTAFFNEATGEFDIAAADLDRLRELAKITNQDFAKLADTARLQAKSGMIDAQIRGNVSETDRAMIQQMATMGKGGRFQMEVLGGKGEKILMDISKVTPTMMKQLSDHNMTLEQRAKDLMTFQENFDAIANMLRLTLLPLMEILGDWAKRFSNWIADLGKWSKRAITGITIALGTFFAYQAMAIAGGIFGTAAGKAMAISSAAGGGMASTAMGGPSASQLRGAGTGARAKLMGTAVVILAIGAALMMVGAGVYFVTQGFAGLAKSIENLDSTQLIALNGMISTIMWSMTAMVGILAITAIALMAFGAAAMTPPMWAAVAVLLAIGAAALMLGAGIGLAAAGMSMLVGEIAKLDGISGVGVELLLISAGIGALALAITALGLAMINPLGMVGGAAAMGVLWALHEMGPTLKLAGEGAELLSQNLRGVGTSLKSLGDSNTGGAFKTLERLGELITNTKQNPIRVLVEGDIGGQLSVDVVGEGGLRKILLNDGRFLRDLTKEIEQRIDLEAGVSGKQS